MSIATSTIERRTLRFETPEQILAEAERLASVPHQLVGRWSFAQIVDHVAKGMDCFYEGFGFQAPWFARTLIAPFVKSRVLAKGMTPGFQLPKGADALLPVPDVSTEQALEHLRVAVTRLIQETPTHPHPFFGKMSPDEVRQLMLRHAEMHFGFVVPN